MTMRSIEERADFWYTLHAFRGQYEDRRYNR